MSSGSTTCFKSPKLYVIAQSKNFGYTKCRAYIAIIFNKTCQSLYFRLTKENTLYAWKSWDNILGEPGFTFHTHPMKVPWRTWHCRENSTYSSRLWDSQKNRDFQCLFTNEETKQILWQLQVAFNIHLERTIHLGTKHNNQLFLDSHRPVVLP